MVLAHMDDAARYEALHPRFHQLFEYFRSHNLLQCPLGRIALDGDDLYINLVRADLKRAEEQKLEVHRQYIDVHFPLSGEEICGLSRLADLTVESDAPFDVEGDFALYSAPAHNYFTVRPGEFYIVWPEDAHAPIIGSGTLVKAIAKVRL